MDDESGVSDWEDVGEMLRERLSLGVAELVGSCVIDPRLIDSDGVREGVRVAVGDSEGVRVADAVGDPLDDFDCDLVNVPDNEGDGVLVDDCSCVGVNRDSEIVGENEFDADAVLVGEAVDVGEFVADGVAVGDALDDFDCDLVDVPDNDGDCVLVDDGSCVGVR